MVNLIYAAVPSGIASVSFPVTMSIQYPSPLSEMIPPILLSIYAIEDVRDGSSHETVASSRARVLLEYTFTGIMTVSPGLPLALPTLRAGASNAGSASASGCGVRTTRNRMINAAVRTIAPAAAKDIHPDLRFKTFPPFKRIYTGNTM